MTNTTPAPQQTQPAPRPVYPPGGGGPTVMMIFGIVMFIVGWAIIGVASSSAGSVGTMFGGLFIGLSGTLFWVTGSIGSRINGWARYNAHR